MAPHQLTPVHSLPWHQLWGCYSSLFKVKEQTDKPCPWSWWRDSLQLQSNSESGPGSKFLRTWGPEGDVCGHKMSENVL